MGIFKHKNAKNLFKVSQFANSKYSKLSVFILVCLLSVMRSVNAQVEQVKMTWTAVECEDSCIKTLERELNKIYGISDVSLDQQAGEALILWKPKVPFQLNSIDAAMKKSRLAIKEMNIRVTGTVRPGRGSLFIVSDGDNTRFELINPPDPNLKKKPGQYYPVNTLAPEARQNLLGNSKQKERVTIEGVVYMPERKLVPIQLIPVISP